MSVSHRVLKIALGSAGVFALSFAISSANAQKAPAVTTASRSEYGPLHQAG